MKKLFLNKKIVFTVILMVIGAIAGAVYEKKNGITTYTSTTALMVADTPNEDEEESKLVGQLGNLEANVLQGGAYRDIVKQTAVLKDAIKRYSHKADLNWTDSSLKNGLEIEFEKTLPVFTLTLQSISKKDSQELLMSLVTSLQERVRHLTGDDNIKIVSSAETNVTANTSSVKVSSVVGALGGFGLSLSLLYFKSVLIDD